MQSYAEYQKDFSFIVTRWPSYKWSENALMKNRYSKSRAESTLTCNIQKSGVCFQTDPKGFHSHFPSAWVTRKGMKKKQRKPYIYTEISGKERLNLWFLHVQVSYKPDTGPKTEFTFTPLFAQTPSMEHTHAPLGPWAEAWRVRVT